MPALPLRPLRSLSTSLGTGRRRDRRTSYEWRDATEKAARRGRHRVASDDNDCRKTGTPLVRGRAPGTDAAPRWLAERRGCPLPPPSLGLMEVAARTANWFR